MTTKKVIGIYTATAIVIANMIGTGVFTSLGFQLYSVEYGISIMLLWLIGGIVALCGALSYSELAAAMPRSGGEYHFLSKIYHPAVGFLSGWISATVGFAAPVALAAMLMGGYAAKVFAGLNPTLIAVGALAIITLIHSLNMKMGSRFQNTVTTLKLLLILTIICCGLTVDTPQQITYYGGSPTIKEIISPAFAISLFWVTYSYSGWNASVYISGEIENAKQVVPRSLFIGTLFVTILYMLLNFTYLYTAPISEMRGNPEVALVAATYIFGITGGKIIGIIIALLLISSISSMVIIGPRVTQMMGEDHNALRKLAVKNKNGIPYLAIIVQSLISLILILTNQFEKVLIYIGFTLNIFTFLTVLGLFVLRVKQPELIRPYKVWGYPLTPGIFLAVTLWILCYGLYSKPIESAIGLATVALGLTLFFIDKKLSHKKHEISDQITN